LHESGYPQRDIGRMVGISHQRVHQIVGVAESLARHDFEILALANAHLDPAHLAAIHSAVTAVREAGRIRIVFPDVTQKPWATRLTPEFRSGACHAGRYRPRSSQSGGRARAVRRLPNARSLSAAIAAGQKSFVEAGGPRAYFGYPGEATIEEGRSSLTALGAILEESVMIDHARGTG
jgi:creatinine amidohydrolase